MAAIDDTFGAILVALVVSAWCVRNSFGKWLENDTIALACLGSPCYRRAHSVTSVLFWM